MTVYIPVPITEEFPPEMWKGIIFCEDGAEYTAVFTKTLYAQPKFSSFTNLNNSTITHWLKKVELPESSNLEVQQIQDSYIKGYEAGEREWISVEDRLPEDSQQYLCCVKREKLSGETVPDELHTGHIFRDKTWIVGSKFEWDFGKVTHWMPLPEPPKAS